MTCRTGQRIGLRAGLIVAASVMVAALRVSGAWAQSAAASPTSSSDNTALEEVVITAERHAETVQAASQSITAISGAELQAQGLITMQDALAEVPGISIGNDGAGLSEIFLRGMASSGGIAPTTGLYLDDVALPGPAQSTYGHTAPDANLYDVRDVEVLRGPQGTLYGASSMGGTIRINTNLPNTSSFAASVQAIGSGTDGGRANGSVNAMLNLPLVENTLAVRVVGSDTYTSGWIDRITLGPNNFPEEIGGAGFGPRGNVLGITPEAQDKNSNWQTVQSGRVTLLWTPNDSLSVAPMVMYQRLYQGGESNVDIPPGAEFNNFYQPYNVAEPYTDNEAIYSLPIKYSFGNNLQFDSATAYVERNMNTLQDSSEDAQFSLNAGYYGTVPTPPATYADIGPTTSFERNTIYQFTQEFRLSSTGSAPLQWLAGLYYQNYRANTVIGSSGIDQYVSTLEAVPVGTQWFNIASLTKLSQYAAFGEASYKLGDFKLTGGLRYYDYKEPPQSSATYGEWDGRTAANAIITTTRASDSGTNPRVNLSYMPNSDLTAYVQASKGFRPGFGNAPAPPGCPNVPSQINPDTVWSYEIGEKAHLMDGGLTLNADVYREDWSDVQAGIGFSVPGCTYYYTGNGGNAEIKGTEIEADLRLTPRLTFTTAAGYADAKWTAVFGNASPFTVGQQLPLVSKFTDTSSLSYTHELSGAYNLVLRATDIYKSDQTWQGYDNPKTNFVNLRAGLSNKQGASLWLFINNAGNVSSTLGASNYIFSELIPYTVRAISPQPRTIGLELNVPFGGH